MGRCLSVMRLGAVGRWRAKIAKNNREVFEYSDDRTLITELMRMAEEGSFAAALIDLIARRNDRIELLEVELRRGIRRFRDAETSDSGFACSRPPVSDPMLMFSEDVHPAITNARIGVHNAKIMACSA